MTHPDSSTLLAFTRAELSAADADALEAHLDDCASCRHAIGALVDHPDAADTAPSVAKTVLTRGSEVNRYLVLELAGAGGMGVIYAAWDPTLDRKVALKLVRPSSDGQATKRLLAEAQLMAKLSHPEVMPVFDAGTVGDQVFIAMEWVQGQTLKAWLATKRDWRVVVAQLLRAGEGLSAAHRAGLVHGDFKPENVLLGDDGRLRVSDFGLAREHHPIDPSDSRLSVVGGTPAYMAPEQRRGETPTPAADQYSFCVTLKEAIPTMPSWLTKVVQRGLAAEPRDRFASMDELLRALRHGLDAPLRQRTLLLTVAAVALAMLGGTAWWRAHSAAEAARCSGGEALVAEVWSDSAKTALLAREKPGQTAAAEVAKRFDGFAQTWAQAYRTSCEATRVRGVQSEARLDRSMLCLRGRLDDAREMLDLLGRPKQKLDPPVIDAVASLSSLGRCADSRTLDALYQPSPTEAADVKVAELRRTIARARQLHALGPLSDALATATTAMEQAKALNRPELTAEAALMLARVQRRGRTTVDEKGRQADLTLDEAILAATEARYGWAIVEAWLQRMRLRIVETNLDAALAADRQVTANLIALGGSPALEVEQQVLRAKVFGHQKRFDAALEAVAAGLTRLASVEPADAQSLRSQLVSERAGIEATTGDLRGARRSYGEVLQLNLQRYGPRSESAGVMHLNLAELSLLEGKVADARQHIDQCAENLDAVYPPEHAMHVVRLVLAAAVLRYEGTLDEAAAVLDDCRQRVERLHLESSVMMVRTLCERGELQLQRGDAATAARSFADALARVPTAIGLYPDDEPLCRSGAARAATSLGRFDEAKTQHQQARAAWVANPWRVAGEDVGLGEVALREGRRAEAVTLLESALAVLERAQVLPERQAAARSALAKAKGVTP